MGTPPFISTSSSPCFLLHLCLTNHRMDLLPDVWRQDYWLPAGVTWRDMDQLANSERPLPQDILIAVPLALSFVALRYVFER